MYPILPKNIFLRSMHQPGTLSTDLDSVWVFWPEMGGPRQRQKEVYLS
jgi:hypothetical protein